MPQHPNWEATIGEQLSNLAQISKKNLESATGLTANTVSKTIACCGLDTSKEFYTWEEIETRFIPARKMLENGMNYKQVGEMFATREPRVGDTAASGNTSSGPSGADVISSGFGELVTEQFNPLLKQTISEYIQTMPLKAFGFMNEFIEKGDVRRVGNQASKTFLSQSTFFQKPSHQQSLGLLGDTVDVEGEESDFDDDMSDDEQAIYDDGDVNT